MRIQSQLLKLLLLLTVAFFGACGGTQSAEPASTSVAVPAEPTSTTDTANTTTETFATTSFDIDDDTTVREVAEGIFVVTHSFPWPANSMIVEMKNGEMVLVDTPYTPEATEAVLAWLGGRLGTREITAINTGFHVDNLGGNEYLISAGIPVYGSEKTVALIEERGEATRAVILDWLQDPADARFHDAFAGLTFVDPNHLFTLEDGLKLRFGDQTVEVYFPGPTHSPDNVVVYFPDRRLLFGGCMVLAGDSVGNTSDADLEAWPISIENLYRFDVDIVVPGHGDRLDPGLLDNTLEVLTGSS